jgi:cytochrome c biogenesis protein CcmG/thiol:disulfide interchange protein DsbE
MSRRRSRLFLTIGFLAVFMASLVGYKIWQGAPPPPTPIVGQRLPATALVTPLSGGEPYPLSDEIVGVTVINYFGSWCGPCRAENPVLLQLRAEGVRLVGVAVRDDPVAAQAFLDNLGDPFFRVMADQRGATMAALNLGADMPQTLVVSADGEILMRHSGPLVGTDGEAALEEIRALAGPR